MKLSIVVPIYGVDKYLRHCLDSIASQTFVDFECILVDDGSKDRCPAICDDFVAQDPRFKVIHYENRGYGAAVNSGIALAKGDWIGIVEPDDWLDGRMYETLIGKTDDGVDVVKCSFSSFFEGGPLGANDWCDLEGVYSLLDNPGLLSQHPSIWSCIYRRSFLCDNEIKLEETPGASWQDNLFQVQTLALARKICFVNKPLYFYQVYPQRGPVSSESWDMPFIRIRAIHHWLSDNHFDAYPLLLALSIRDLTYIDLVAKVVPLSQWRAFLNEARELFDAISAVAWKSKVQYTGETLKIFQSYSRNLKCSLLKRRLSPRSFLPRILRDFATKVFPPRGCRLYSIYDLRSDHTAWTKAPADVARIIASISGCMNIPFVSPPFRNKLELLFARLRRLLIDFRLLFILPRKSTVLLQMPGMFLSGANGALIVFMLAKLRKINVIVLVHDLGFARDAQKGDIAHPDFEFQAIIRWSAAIIVHNARMKDFIQKAGVKREKLIDLRMFDYLSGDILPGQRVGAFASVAIAGNLDSKKAGYLKSLHKIGGVEWHLFGTGFSLEKTMGENILYEGCFPPDELPQHLRQSFGLVWDGPSIETCCGAFGEYMKINNPHKLSLYLSAGMPVLIWDRAAAADFVRENKVGILISSLRDIPASLASISPDQYRMLRENACSLAKKLRAGYFLTTAIERALSVVKGDAPIEPA